MNSGQISPPGRSSHGRASGQPGAINAPRTCRHGKTWTPAWVQDHLVYILKNWFVNETGDAFTSPEAKRIMVGGNVYNHPSIPDGKTIVTSTIEEVYIRYILTNTGSVYKLHGRPKKEYYEWLIKNGHIYDGYEPIKIIRKM